MCAMMSLIAAKSDYIVKANSVYRNLQDFEEVFAYEAAVLNRAKCILVRDEELEDFNVDGINVSVYRSKNGYQLNYLDYVMDIDVYEKQIIDFSVRKN